MRAHASIPLLAGLAALLALAGCAPTRLLLTRPVERTGSAPQVLFVDVRVFDGTGEVLSAPLDVLVAEGRIAWMKPAGAEPRPPGATIVDGRGRTLLPGLVDAHVHIGGAEGEPPWSSHLPNADAQAAAALYAGVTTALLPGAGPDTAAFAREIAQGRKAGPRLYYATARSRWSTATPPRWCGRPRAGRSRAG